MGQEGHEISGLWVRQVSKLGACQWNLQYMRKGSNSTDAFG
jgi:hypothetical protein